jgi:hypothetical protein
MIACLVPSLGSQSSSIFVFLVYMGLGVLGPFGF